jgi:hypothetical protein
MLGQHVTPDHVTALIVGGRRYIVQGLFMLNFLLAIVLDAHSRVKQRIEYQVRSTVPDELAHTRGSNANACGL